MKLWWPCALVAAGVACLGAAKSGGLELPHGPVTASMVAGGGGAALASAAGALLFRKRRSSEALADGGLVAAVRAWDQGETGPLRAWLRDLVGEQAADHAARSAALCQRMAEQLAVPADDAEELALAAFAHLAPAAFETGVAGCGEHGEEALAPAIDALVRSNHAVAAEIVAQVGERWDGLGGPRGLVGEATLLRGRILAVVCAFDRASAAGLEPGLAFVRGGSGAAFDPVVAAELIHLFREPWQLKQAA